MIESSAFEGCSKLTSVVIPKSVEGIGEYAFGGCRQLRITVEKGNENYHVAGNCLIETTTKQLLWGRWNSTIPADGSVICIGARAFAGCWELTNIIIPNGVTGIEGFAFSGCDLMSVIIPRTVTFIGENAFDQNSSLSEIKVESGNTVYHSVGNCLMETAA
ncbi:MAG: leucine-rich repeat domain-containing protein [Clostridia bacterium]|nr:leucine-rich repeat domain-containing protein [Clostridia bacterium]